MKNEYYSDFDSFKKKLNKQEKTIKDDLNSYKSAIGNSNTKDIEDKLKNNLNSFNELINELNEAYKDKNAPNMNQNVLERKREEINKFNKSYKNMKETFDLLSNEKHSYKVYISNNNINKEEYNNMNSRELVNKIDDTIKEQDDQADKIKELIDNKGHTEINGLRNNIEKSNEKVNEGIEYIETADSKIIKLNNRLVKYLANSSNWCLRISLIVQIVIAIALIIVFTKV